MWLYLCVGGTVLSCRLGSHQTESKHRALSLALVHSGSAGEPSPPTVAAWDRPVPPASKELWHVQSLVKASRPINKSDMDGFWQLKLAFRGVHHEHFNLGSYTSNKWNFVDLRLILRIWSPTCLGPHCSECWREKEERWLVGSAPLSILIPVFGRKCHCPVTQSRAEGGERARSEALPTALILHFALPLQFYQVLWYSWMIYNIRPIEAQYQFSLILKWIFPPREQFP